MGAYAGPKTPTRNLVFAYSMGNTKNSFKGMPTTNLKVNGNGDFSNGTTDWIVTSGVSTEILPKFKGARNVLKLTRTANVAGYNGIRSTGITVSPSTWYTFSMRIFIPAAMQQNIRLYCGERADTTILNWRVVQTSSASPGGTWQILTSSFQTGATANNFAQAPYLDWNTTASTIDEVVYVDWYQVEQQSFGTPFVDGTRSNTQALLDMAGGNTITATSLTYAADNTFSFDGSGTTDGVTTGDYISVTESLTKTDTTTYPNGCTYNFWLYVDSDAVDRMALFWGAGTIRHIELYSTGRYFRTEAATENGYSFGTSTFPDAVRGAYSHFSIVFANGESGRPVRWYQNGTLFHTHTSMDSGTGGATEYFSFSGIGRSTGSVSFAYAKSFDGEIPNFSIYDKALTASEVKQNFNAIRGRFGI